MNQPIDRLPLGAKFQPAPSVLVITASRLREFDLCRRRYFLARVLNLRDETNPDASLDPAGELPNGRPDQSGVSASTIGSYVHEELHARHSNPGTHHQTNQVCAEQPPIPAVSRAVQRHLDLCPGQDGAEYVGGEIDLRWFIPGKATLVNGRIDALWRHPDGTVEVRDYKTGAPIAELGEDVGALIYAILVAAHYPGSPIRVTYEYLGNEPEAANDRLVSLDVTRQHLAAARQRIDTAIARIRTEQQFPPTPTEHVCKWCPFRTNCDAARSLQQ